MNNAVEIDYLANHTACIPRLAGYSYAEWRPVYDMAGLTCDDAERSYAERINTDVLPLALVALSDGEIVGTGSLKVHDLEIRSMYTPWLGGMYVVESHRGRGTGSVLISHLLREAVRLGLEELYLWTPHSGALYARHGWQHIEQLDYAGYRISVMHQKIANQSH